MHLHFWRRDNRSDSSPKKELVSNLLIIATAIIAAALITLFVFQSYRVDGESMEDTLQNNDRLIIDKIPRTMARITGHPYIPHRGDIVVFNKFGAFSSSEAQNKQLIKRVIGLPGDRVVIKNGQITIFNQANPNGFNADMGTWQLANTGSTGDTEIVLGPNQIFVCGDNRNYSVDSRSFGPINASDIVGKLVVRFMPLNKHRIF